MRCRWCAETEISEPGLCGACQAEPDAVEFNDAHDEQCGCGGEHVLTVALPLEST
jgi:hypothetical protein